MPSVRTHSAVTVLPLVAICLLSSSVGVAGVYPGAAWATKTPAEVGLDAAQLGSYQGYVGGWGCVVRHGYMVHTWGSQSTRADVASACKPFFTHFLFNAVKEGKLASLDDLVVNWEPCINNLNPTLGYKDRNITFRHMANQISCYGVSEAPGSAYAYNDWQMALFFDTLLLKVYNATNHASIDTQILRPKLTDILQCQDNPTFMAFGTGDRPGRVSISVRDFARFGLLYLNKGNWNGTRIISEENAAAAVTSPVPNSIPRSSGVAAQMCPGQRSIGSTTIPDNQTDHLGSYSFAWWTNGVDRNGQRNWPNAPLDTYGAFGHRGKEAMFVIPSLGIVASYNGSPIDTFAEVNEAIRRLVAAVQYTCDPGAPARADLGESDVENCLERVDVTDGGTIAVSTGNRNCRRTEDSASDNYMYFAVQDTYAHQGSKSDVYITIDYFDQGTDAITLQYDSAAGAYTNGSTIQLTDAQVWKQYTFHVADAYFGNRQNNGADLRFAMDSGYLYLDVVRVGDQPEIPEGSIVVDAGRRSWFKRHGGGPFFMSGPGDPEGFLYRGTRNADGTRSGDQMTLINKMIGTGANCIYVIGLRSHGGDGGSTENPFANSDVNQPLDAEILDQWETWFSALDDHNIVIFFVFYDDSATPFGVNLPVGGELDAREQNYIDTVVARYRHHKNLIWCVAEEYGEGVSPARAAKIAERIKQTDFNGHPVAIHQNSGTSFDFNGNLNFDQFAVQWNQSTASALHAGTLAAWNNVAGQVNINMAEFADAGSGAALRQKNWAIAMAGGYSMVLGMDVASTAVSDLQDCGRLVRFMESTRFNECSPNDALARGNTDYVLADSGDVYIAYGDAGTSLGLAMQAGDYAVKWFDPVDGDWVNQGVQTLSAGDQTFAKPALIGAEAALYISKPSSTASAPAQAYNPSPSYGAVGIGLAADLTWAPGSGAESHDVYFGASNPPAFQLNQAQNTYDPGPLTLNTTYYWRIDEVNSQGATAGTVWSFTTGDGLVRWDDLGTQQNLGNGRTPGVATDSLGNIHVVYMNGGGIYYRQGTPEAVFGSAETIPVPAGSGEYNSPHVVCDVDNVPHVVFEKDYASTSKKAWYTNRIGGSWKTPVTALAPPATDHRVNYPRLALYGAYAFVGGFTAGPTAQGQIARLSNLSGTPTVDITVSTGLWVPTPTVDDTGRLFVVGRNGASGHYVQEYNLNLNTVGSARKISTGTPWKTGEATAGIIDSGNVIHAAGIAGVLDGGGEFDHDQFWYNSTARLDQGQSSILGLDFSTGVDESVYPTLAADTAGKIYMTYRDYITGQGKATLIAGDQYATPVAVASRVSSRLRWNTPAAPAPTGGVYVVWEDDGSVYFRPVGVGSAVLPTQVSVDLGTTDVPSGMTHPVGADGVTVPATIGGRECRSNLNPNQDFYFYFAVDNWFAFQASKPDLYIAVDYYDAADGELELQYDSSDSGHPNPAYKPGGVVTLLGDNQWKAYQFHITDAYFGNRQNLGADLRIFKRKADGAPGGTFYLDLVRVSASPLIIVPGDFDGDRDVDQDDFGVLQSCYTEPEQPYASGCEAADLDGDENVDQDDANVFRGCMGGANNPPEC